MQHRPALAAIRRTENTNENIADVNKHVGSIGSVYVPFAGLHRDTTDEMHKMHFDGALKFSLRFAGSSSDARQETRKRGFHRFNSFLRRNAGASSHYETAWHVLQPDANVAGLTRYRGLARKKRKLLNDAFAYALKSMSVTSGEGNFDPPLCGGRGPRRSLGFLIPSDLYPIYSCERKL